MTVLHVALFEPEIPPNTGNVMRLCANTGAQLHLIHPLGFELDNKRLRRAGLDYRDIAQVKEYENWAEFLKQHSSKRIFSCTTKAQQRHSHAHFKKDDILLFGPETRGLPDEILQLAPSQNIKIPMVKNSRSLNLSNAVAVILFEAWRQLEFDGVN